MESALMPTTEGAILERIIEPEKAHLAPDVARYLLTLDFSSADRERMQQLAEKAQADTLTPAEKQDSENYQRVGQLLARMKDRARQVLAPSPPQIAESSCLISPGIRRSQEAFWRELPELLKDKRKHGKWVCYHGDERIALGRTQTDLYQECFRRGLERGEFYVGKIKEEDTPPWGTFAADWSLYEVTEGEGAPLHAV